MSEHYDKYTERCNDPVKRAEWRGSGLVEVRTLRKGDVFESISGLCYQVNRREDNGLIHSKPWGHDGNDGLSIPSAMVRPLMRSQHVEIEE